jgi:hypothetical protein
VAGVDDRVRVPFLNWEPPRSPGPVATSTATFTVLHPSNPSCLLHRAHASLPRPPAGPAARTNPARPPEPGRHTDAAGTPRRSGGLASDSSARSPDHSLLTTAGRWWWGFAWRDPGGRFGPAGHASPAASGPCPPLLLLRAHPVQSNPRQPIMAPRAAPLVHAQQSTRTPCRRFTSPPPHPPLPPLHRAHATNHPLQGCSRAPMGAREG